MQPQRRTYSKSFEAQVTQECAEPGTSIANIALSHTLNSNLVHKWIRLHAQKSLVPQPAFIPPHTQPLISGRIVSLRTKKAAIPATSSVAIFVDAAVRPGAGAGAGAGSGHGMSWCFDWWKAAHFERLGDRWQKAGITQCCSAFSRS